MSTAEFIVQIAGPVGTALLGLLIWSLKRNVRSQDDTLKKIDENVAKLAGTTAAHATSLAVGNEKFRAIEGRVGKLEERELQRLEAMAGVRATPVPGDGG